MIGAFLRAHGGKLGQHVIEGVTKFSDLVIAPMIDSQGVVLGFGAPSHDASNRSSGRANVIGQCRKKNAETRQGSEEHEASI